MFVAMLALAAWSCNGGDKAAGPKAARAVPVAVATAVKKTVPVNIQAVGNVESMASVSVKTQVGGLIMEQYVVDGQDVAEGDKLFLIDPRPFELSLAEAEAKIERDRALLQNAEEDLARYARLKEKDVISKESYDHTLAQARTLRGTIKVSEAERDRAKLDLEYAHVRSPITGRVGAILLHKGNVIKANDDRVLVVINRIRPIYVSFSVPERYLPGIMARMKAGPVTVTAQADGEATTETGVLSALNNTVDTTTGAIRLKASFTNADAALWPGQFVRVTIALDQRQGVVVPTPAVQEGLRGPYLYVVKPDNTVEPRDLKIYGIVGGETVLNEGVADGEVVVTDGQLRLTPGAAVEAKGGPGAAKEAGAGPTAAKAAETPGKEGSK
ncbi:efflux RND transporter periplasmic adaptor subunit [Desulfolutivibrio sulfodismutans]|uniref:efflux RND transporter periplasmic adaptor subunit n=1 Tax=Desulfolutivibrio sulfodismutans TaxID=63561 RepID=UPI003F5DED8E|nr:efflux RND transporter periplasmic adaptor subunit [Desulfolutivibrio sulfodismutans DSM 3696]